MMRVAFTILLSIALGAGVTTRGDQPAVPAGAPELVHLGAPADSTSEGSRSQLNSQAVPASTAGRAKSAANTPTRNLAQAHIRIGRCTW